MSLSDYLEQAICEALRGTPLDIDNVYVKLHIGDPGENGTANAAGETTRKVIAFDAAVGGVMVNASDITWTNVSTSETYSHASLWDAVSGGNCLAAGALTTPKAVVAGDNATLSDGQASFTIT